MDIKKRRNFPLSNRERLIFHLFLLTMAVRNKEVMKHRKLPNKKLTGVEVDLSSYYHYYQDVCILSSPDRWITAPTVLSTRHETKLALNRGRAVPVVVVALEAHASQGKEWGKTAVMTSGQKVPLVRSTHPKITHACTLWIRGRTSGLLTPRQSVKVRLTASKWVSMPGWEGGGGARRWLMCRTRQYCLSRHPISPLSRQAGVRHRPLQH